MMAHFPGFMQVHLYFNKQNCWVKPVLWAHQTSHLSEMISSCKCFPHVSKMFTLTYNRANSVIIKNAIILNIIYNIFDVRDTEVDQAHKSVGNHHDYRVTRYQLQYMFCICHISIIISIRFITLCI